MLAIGPHAPAWFQRDALRNIMHELPSFSRQEINMTAGIPCLSSIGTCEAPAREMIMTHDLLQKISAYRLLVSPEHWARLRALPAHPLITRCAALLDEQADRFTEDFTIPVDETGHNYHLIRARKAQIRVVSLLVQYGRTGDRRYRQAALEYLRLIAGWEYWSWIKWREQDPAYDAIFDLSYGENAVTLALAYDSLAAELTPEERAPIVETARARALQPYLARNGVEGQEMWYFRSPNCNWNTVCNGGIGMLALALGDACPESAAVLARAEEGVRHYFEFLQEDGAWPEGIGYWGYGHRYGYLYLLSHERATGRPHPLLARPGSRNTLRFPLLFSPHGVAAGFGDSNHFFPLPFHYAAAERFGMADIHAELDRRMMHLLDTDPRQLCDGAWPALAEMLLFHPGTTAEVPCDWPRVAVQKGLDWCTLADCWPAPRLYASVRGGTTEAPHTHQDLLSVNVVVDGEPLLRNQNEAEYIDTTFSDRRYEMYENSAASKNTLLVNGVGLPHPGAAGVEMISGDGWEGVILDGTAAARFGSPVRHCSRAVLLLADAALLIIDRVALEHAGQMEARFHTVARVRATRVGARLNGAQTSLHLAFAASVPACLRLAKGLPTSPAQEAETVLRWMTAGRQPEAVLVTLLTPCGRGRVRFDARRQRILAAGPGFAVTLPLVAFQR